MKPDEESGRPDKREALVQWTTLHHTIIRLGGFVNYIEPQPDLPDMVFTANGGLVHGNKVVVSNFAREERMEESVHFRLHFRQQGLQILDLDPSEPFEGNGDAFIFNHTLYLGAGTRTKPSTGWKIVEFFGLKKMVICDLVDPRFYHLDTCFCPLEGNDVLLFPGAFSEATYEALKTEKLNIIKASEEDAQRFACNAVVLDRNIILPAGSDQLMGLLTRHNYKCHPVEMGEFMKAGGAAKCLTLKV